MSTKLLVSYLKLVFESVKDARVPNQLMDPEELSSDENETDAHDVKEFSAVGAIAGYTAPLGMSPDKLGRKKNSRNKKKK